MHLSSKLVLRSSSRISDSHASKCANLVVCDLIMMNRPRAPATHILNFKSPIKYMYLFVFFKKMIQFPTSDRVDLLFVSKFSSTSTAVPVASTRIGTVL
eukprot:SAG31_NODE_4472_length_3204_cov_7.250242_1_plen_99_part_00